jgi:hypothetical protein
MQPPVKKLECRVAEDLLGVPLVLGTAVVGFSIMEAYSPQASNDALPSFILLGFLGLPCVWILLYYLRGRIIADQNGLLFQGVIRRRFVPWHEIEDYYFQFAPESSGETKNRAFLIVRGKRTRLSRNFKLFDSLLDFVATHATAAAASKWEPIETRDLGTWPKTFAGHDTSGWSLFGLYLALTVVLSVVFLLRAGSRGLSQSLSLWAYLSPVGKFGFIFALWFLVGLFPSLILLQYPAIRRRRPYLSRVITVSLEGLEFHDTDRTVFVPWTEIHSYHLESVPGLPLTPLCALETSTGRWEFLSTTGGRELKAIIAARAVNATTKNWSYALGHDNDALTPTTQGSTDEHRFHYRTRTNRAGLLLPSFMALVGLVFPCIIPMIYEGNLPATDAPQPASGYSPWPVMCFILLLLPTVYGWCAWFRSYLTYDQYGLTQHSLLGRRTIPWAEITSLREETYYTVTGQHTTIRFGIVADVTFLCAEIAERAVNAEPPGWQKTGTGEPSRLRA